MYYLIYKVTNNINGKYYIGAHITKNKQDSYLGSGVALKKAVKKYGKENFSKEILHECISKEEMFELEEKLVCISDKNSYNMRMGGKGGWDHVDSRGEKNAMKRPEVAKKCVESNRRSGTYTSKKRIEHLKRISLIAAEKNTGKKRPKHAILIREWAKNNWKENREKIRDSLSTTFEVTDPNGEVYVTNRLQNFCEERGLAYTTLWNTSKTLRDIKRGRSKGWKCKIIQT